MSLRMRLYQIALMGCACVLPIDGSASPHSLVGTQFFLHKTSAPPPTQGADLRQRGTPVPEDTGRGAVALRSGAASLFRGRDDGGLFAPVLTAPHAPPAAKQLMQLIAQAEAGKAGYDAVQHGARRRPTKPPTSMTVAEIYDWINRTPGQPHAIGRYQLIPATLRRLVKHQGVGLHERFTPDIQDRLAHQLLEEAGLSDFRSAAMSRETFMLNLAKIWAGLPTSNGKSYYEGYAGNSAVLSWAHFKAEFQRIFPS